MLSAAGGSRSDPPAESKHPYCDTNAGRGVKRMRRARTRWKPQQIVVKLGMLRLRVADRFALRNASLSMTELASAYSRGDNLALWLTILMRARHSLPNLRDRLRRWWLRSF